MMAGGKHYFGTDGFPVTVRRVCTTPQKTPSHPHDLTEVKHRHDFCELVIVAQGNALHRLEETSFPVSAGDVFLLQGRQSHYFHERKNLVLINVMFDPEKLGLPENELRRLPGYCALFILEPSYRRLHRFASRLHLARVPLAHVMHLAEEIEKECQEKSHGFEAAIRAKLIELIVYLSRAYTVTETIEAQALLRVGHVIGALENDFSKDWKIPSLLKIAHMSRSHLMRVFRKATGQTPIEYLIRLRIQKAMELLRQTDLNITEIALTVGFNDSNYFSRQFLKTTGCTPSSFRLQTRSAYFAVGSPVAANSFFSA
jgi:AraC-like DNA-binding protein/quercetin dioxygenase-like cupin family protein